MSCKPVVRWWQEGSSPPEKPKPVAAEAPIDLTSDDEDGGQGCLRQGSVEGSLEAPGTACPENYKTKAKIEIERGSPKRPAGEISPDPSDEVEVVLKPRTEVGVSVERQSKRSKSRKAGDEEDVEMLGSAGEVLLPHLRFDCPKKEFVEERPDDHKEQCDSCFCFVCDRPANGCTEWFDHCHAYNRGEREHIWQNLRVIAKRFLVRGQRPPTSGLYSSSSSSSSREQLKAKNAWSPSGTASRETMARPSRASWPSSREAPSTTSAPRTCPDLLQVRGTAGVFSGSGSRSGSSARCKLESFEAFSPTPVHGAGSRRGGGGSSSSPWGGANAPFTEASSNLPLTSEASFGSQSPIASSFGLKSSVASSAGRKTARSCDCKQLCKVVAEVLHGGDIDHFWESTVVVYLRRLTMQQRDHVNTVSIARVLQRMWESRLPPSASSVRKEKRDACAKKFFKAHHPRVHTVQREDGTFDMIVMAYNSKQPEPWLGAWKRQRASCIHLGRIGSLRFSLGLDRSTPEERRVHFERYVSDRPVCEGVFNKSNRNRILIDFTEESIFACLEDGFCQQLIAIDMEAAYNPSTDSGFLDIEVILLPRAFNQSDGTRMIDGTRMTDFRPIVERILLSRKRSSKVGVYGGPSLADVGKAGSRGANGKGVMGKGGLGGAGATEDLRPTPSTAVEGRVFEASVEGCGSRASLDVSIDGLLASLNEERCARQVQQGELYTPSKMLNYLENVQHRRLRVQPSCLTVELYEHQLQDVQWMIDQENMDGGIMRHLWAEFPRHPEAPEEYVDEFRRFWFSPALGTFTCVDPFQSPVKGGLLCDEMGLGKTAVTLALVMSHRPSSRSSPEEWGRAPVSQEPTLEDPVVLSKGTLVVCKLSLVGQWVQEAKRLMGGAVTIYPYHGATRRRDLDFLASQDIVVTTYGILMADESRYHTPPPLRSIRWWRVVLDESHTMSTRSGTGMDAVNALSSCRRWCMTGTPFNTKFSDVCGQLKFLGLGKVFGKKDLGDHRPYPAFQPRVLYVLRRIMMRHSLAMKLGSRSILGLPSIKHKVEVLDLTPAERRAYLDFEKRIQKDYWKIRDRLRYSGASNFSVVATLEKFRQACSGGQLLLNQDDVGDGEDDGEDSTRGSASQRTFCPLCGDLYEALVRLPCGHVFCKGCLVRDVARTGVDNCPKCRYYFGPDALQSAVQGGKGKGKGKVKVKPEEVEGRRGCFPTVATGSACPSEPSLTDALPGVAMESKLKVLVGMLKAIKSKDSTSKSLVFSQFNSSLQWLRHELPKHGFQYRTLDGSMSMRQRTDALRAFAQDPPTTVFLLSVRSGAVGINLTQANHVFLLEPLLNLALEKQAIGRVHRLGQTRDVEVTKLVLRDSLETRILKLQLQQSLNSSDGSSWAGADDDMGVAGSISRDDAKHLKIQEYDFLFGVDSMSFGAGSRVKSPERPAVQARGLDSGKGKRSAHMGSLSSKVHGLSEYISEVSDFYNGYDDDDICSEDEEYDGE